MTPGSAGPRDAAIRVEGVSKRYTVTRQRQPELKGRALDFLRGRPSRVEHFWALRHVDLAVDRGETVAVIGENGSGKSTLLQLIAGILEPDEGRVTVQGRVTAILELGSGFNPELTGRENIFLNGSLLGLKREELRRRFDEIVAFAELEEFIDNPVRVYSSGMAIRLGFSIAALLDPEVLLVDEVLAVGDEAFRRKCLMKVRELKARGTTVLLVSHDLLAVECFCERAYALDHGQVVASGPVTDTIARYHDLASHTISSGNAARPGGRRWGTGEVRLRSVDLAASGPSQSPRTGDAVTVRLSYEAPKRVAAPVFGLAFRSEGGVTIAGPNTKMGGFAIDAVDGSGVVEYRIEKLPLLPGEYELSAAIYDQDLNVAYDHWERCLAFLVVEGGTLERFGVVQFAATWHHSPSPVGAALG